MSEKHEHISEPRCFYAFVDLKVSAGQMPVTYIIPSQVVADVLKRSDETWLKTLGGGGRAHRTNPVRQVLPVYGFPDARQVSGRVDRKVPGALGPLAGSSRITP